MSVFTPHEILHLIFEEMTPYTCSRQLGAVDWELIKIDQRNLFNAAMTTRSWTDAALGLLWSRFVQDLDLLKILGLYEKDQVRPFFPGFPVPLTLPPYN